MRPGGEPPGRGVPEREAGAGAGRTDRRRAAVQDGGRDDGARTQVELESAGRGERAASPARDERLGAPRTGGYLQQRAIGRHVHLDTVDLVVLRQLQPCAGERRVIGEADTVGGQEASAADTHPLRDLVRDPVLVGHQPAVAAAGLAPDRAVGRPPVPLPGGLQIERHQEIALVHFASRRADAQLGRPDIKAELERASRC